MRLRISSRQPPTSGTPARRSHRHRHSTCTQVHLRKRYQGKVAGYAARQLIVRCGKIYPASDRTSSNRSKGQSHRQAHSRHWSHIYFLGMPTYGVVPLLNRLFIAVGMAPVNRLLVKSRWLPQEHVSTTRSRLKHLDFPPPTKHGSW